MSSLTSCFHRTLRSQLTTHSHYHLHAPMKSSIGITQRLGRLNSRPSAHCSRTELHSLALIPAPTLPAPTLPAPTHPTILSFLRQTASRFATHRDHTSSSYRLRFSPGSPPPPSPRRRSSLARWLDRNVPEDGLLWGIVGLNVLVFVGWKMAEAGDATDGRRMSTKVRGMFMNFTTSWRNTLERPWTLLTSFFSHMSIWHLGFNMFTFYFLAPPVLSILGPAKFLGLYFGGGVAANVVSALSYKLGANGGRGRDVPSLGASAAVYSIVSYLACHAPRTTFQLYGIVPVPAWLAVSGLFAYDLYSSMNGLQPGTNTLGHVTGMLAGAVYFVGRKVMRV